MREAPRPRPRRAAAVLLSRFPLITETFILREVAEMERQGQPVRLVPLLRESGPIRHREAGPWTARALYAPFLSPAIVAANLRALRRSPGRYVGLLGRVVAGNLGSPGFLTRSAVLFPKAVYLAERLRAEGVGHVHAHFATHPALVAYVVSSLTGIPFSVTVHAHDLFVRRAMLGRKLRAASFVRAISRFNRDYLVALEPALAGRVEVIHAGVDLDAYGAVPAPPELHPLVLCVAALKPYKGLGVLVEAWRRLRDEGVAGRCEVVGEGPERPRLERAIARAGLGESVRLRGALPQHEVAPLVARAALVVQPSVVAPDGQMEGIPVALMEAMASGRAVVASRLSGIPELVEDGASGLLVPPGDAAALASALRSLLEDPARAREMGARGRERVAREFRLADNVAALLERMEAHGLPAHGDLSARLALCPWPALAGRRVGLRRRHERIDSSVAELLVADGREAREAVLKVQKRTAGRPAAESARHEFETLARLHRCFASGEAGFGVPRPLHLDGAGGALVMEACRGTPLDALLREGRTSRDRLRRAALEAAVRRAGRWLRLLQRYTPCTPPASEALAALVRQAREDLRSLAGWELTAEEAQTLQRRLEGLAREAEPRARRLVGRHGDFWPGNVYVADGLVEVIDFEGFADGLPEEDAAYFLVQLELFCSYPLLRSLRARLRDAFLDGYAEGAPLDPVLYPLCRLAKGLRILRQGVAAPSSALRRWWRTRALRAALRHEV